jgi:DNA-binding response OmpR family regulator
VINRTVLLVEDNPQDEFLMLRALRKAKVHATIDVVRDGQQAVDYLLRTGEFSNRSEGLPAFVLLDLNLPKLSGLDVLKRLRAEPHTQLLPVVMFTSSDDDRDRVRSYNSGANSFVSKPLEFAEFMTSTGRLGTYWLETNIPP